MTAPLVPKHVNLRAFQYMPLDVVRLRDSDFAAQSGGEAFRCALLLWCAAWHQIPAGSLPDDDKVLASFVGMARTPRHWKKFRDEALKGFVKCSDNRLYHPVVAEKALEAWQAHLRDRFKNEMGRLKKAAERAKITAQYPSFDDWRTRYESTGNPTWPLEPVPTTEGGCPGDVPKESGSKGREGKGRESKALLHTSSSADRSSRCEALARALRRAGFEDCSAGHPEIVAAAAEGVSEAGMAAAAVGCGDKSVTYIARRAVGQLRDAQAAQAGGQPRAAAPALDDEARAERDWRLDIENQMIDVRHLCDHMGAITPEVRDQRIGALRQRLEAGRQGQREVTA